MSNQFTNSPHSDSTHYHAQGLLQSVTSTPMSTQYTQPSPVQSTSQSWAPSTQHFSHTSHQFINSPHADSTHYQVPNPLMSMNLPDLHQVSNLLQTIIQPVSYSDILRQLPSPSIRHNLLQWLPPQCLIIRNPIPQILDN